ncbi:MAG: helix-turn-helix domain-containing protein [Erythrobacter sp.]
MSNSIQIAALDEERRSEGRRELHLDTSAEQAGGRAAVRILDLSAKGMLLSTQAKLDHGELLTVVLADGVERAASVAWNSGNLFGCRFESPLSRAQLGTALLAARPRTADSSETVPTAIVRGGLSSAATFGERIRALRLASPYTMAAFAQLLGVSKQTLWRWESDQVRPRAEALERLVAILGVDERELCYGSDIDAAHTDAGPGASTVAQVVDRARHAIATAAGVAPGQVKIAIDFS